VNVTTGNLVAKCLEGGGKTGALLRQVDWSHHPFGPPEQWSPALQTMTSVMLSSQQPMFVLWGPDYIALYNDGYADICGNRHPASLAKPFALLWHDIWTIVEPMVKRVYAGESIHMDDIQFVMTRHGYPEETHFSFFYTPLRDETGEIGGLYCACTETTKQVMLQRELDLERALLGQIFEQAPSFIARLDGPEHRFTLVNPAFMALIGQRDVIGKTVLDAIPEVDGQGYLDLLDGVLRTGQATRLNAAQIQVQRVKDGPLENRYVDFVYQPIRNAAGDVSGVFVEGVDVTDRVNALQSLQASEQFLQSVIAASPDCIKVLDLDGRLEYLSDGGRLVLEVPVGETLIGRNWQDLWDKAEKANIITAVTSANSGQPSRFSAYANTFAGNRRYWDVRVAPMLDTSGTPVRILAVSRDLTYLKQIEEEREHLMHELSHRLKNAFSMVQSVISQTLRRATSVSEARDILAGRVRALSDAQNILTKSVTTAMDLHEVVEAALLPHRTGDGRFQIDGPAAIINGRQGLGLSLTLHELATNATKYGALHGESGTVSIRWDIQGSGAFVFSWQETGGPRVTPPTQTGFGSVLIENIVATYFDGAARLDFLPEGVSFHLNGKIAAPDNLEPANPY
jgi:PAS domain S-box-containing protein